MSVPPSLRRRIRAARRVVLARRRALAALLVALAVLIGLRATVGPPPATIRVPVASHDLEAGHRLAAADIATVAWPSTLAPSGLSGAVVDRVLAAPVRRGEAITDVGLVGPELAQAHPELTVMPVRLPDAAVVGLLRVGDRLDLSAVDPETGTTHELAADVLVLAVPPEGGSDSTLTGRLVVAGIPPASADAVAGAALHYFITVAYTR